MCEMRGIPFTGSGSASSHLAFDKVAAKRFAAIAGVKAPAGIALEDIEAAFAEYGRLIAKPARDGSSYGLIFVNAKQDIVAVRNAAKTEEYVIEPFIAGVGSDLRRAGAGGRLGDRAAADRDHPGRRRRSTTRRNISPRRPRRSVPGRFAPEISAQIMDQALRAHRALSCARLFPHRFHRLGQGAGLSRNQHLAGPDQGLALPEGAQGRRESNSPISCTTRSRWPKNARKDGVNCRLDGRAEPAGSTVIAKILTNYRQSYSESTSNRALPRPNLPFVYQEVRRLTLAAHVALGCRGVSCCGFPLRDRIEGTGGLFCLEVSTQPGMTETSYVPELASVCGHNS